MREPNALEVSYQIPPTCSALEFKNEGFRPDIAASLRGDWQAADECTEFDGKQIRRKNASCSALRLRVPATTRMVDRVYPWAYPIEDGLYAHTVAFAVTEACGKVDWSFVVPDGTVVIDGRMMAERGYRTAAEGGGDGIPTVLIREPFASNAAPRVHASRKFSPSTLGTLNSAVASIEGELKKALPGLEFSVPFIVASASEPGHYWGDVANRTVMRLSFPPTPGPEQEQLLTSFVTHEMAHLTQPSNWDDRWREDGATLTEGGAEFLRLAIVARLGWLDRAALQIELDKAVNDCVLAAEGKPWKTMRNRNWGTNPYHCGLVFYIIGLASNPVSERPFLKLRNYYARARQGEHTEFAQAIECGAITTCKPRWISRFAGKEPLEAVLMDYARRPDSLLRATSEWSVDLTKQIAFRHLGTLMRADCMGNISMYREANSARIADGPPCSTLRPDMVIIKAEGVPMFDDISAVRASVRACQERGKTVLGLRDGRSVIVACARDVSIPSQLYSVRIEKFLTLTK